MASRACRQLVSTRHAARGRQHFHACGASSTLNPRPAAALTCNVQARASRLQSGAHPCRQTHHRTGSRDTGAHSSVQQRLRHVLLERFREGTGAARSSRSSDAVYGCTPRAFVHRPGERGNAAAAAPPCDIVADLERPAAAWPATAMCSLNPCAAGGSHVASNVSSEPGAQSCRQRRCRPRCAAVTARRRLSPRNSSGCALHRLSCIASSCCIISLATDVICELAW